MCEKCERSLAGRKQLCPFRSISNDHCEEYETIEKELQALQLLKEAYKIGIFSIRKHTMYTMGFLKHEIECVICDAEEYSEKKINEEQYCLLKEVLESEV